MLQDVYFMNRLTGELMASGAAIHEFYKTHGALERWTDEWEETDIPVEGQFLTAPNFAGAVKKF